jgi:hypothetical protein
MIEMHNLKASSKLPFGPSQAKGKCSQGYFNLSKQPKVVKHSDDVHLPSFGGIHKKAPLLAHVLREETTELI